MPGHAGLSEEMYDEGFKSIANIDISKVVIDQMTEKYRDKTGLTCTSAALRGCGMRLPCRRRACVGGKLTARLLQGNT